MKILTLKHQKYKKTTGIKILFSFFIVAFVLSFGRYMQVDWFIIVLQPFSRDAVRTM